jgi:hypothetical protein
MVETRMGDLAPELIIILQLAKFHDPLNLETLRAIDKHRRHMKQRRKTDLRQTMTKMVM